MLKLTHVKITTPNMVYSFVTHEPYGVVARRVIATYGLAAAGEVSYSKALEYVYDNCRHYPSFGDCDNHNALVGGDGFHVHVNEIENMIYIGQNNNNKTWGHVVLGGDINDIDWTGSEGKVLLGIL